VATANPATSSYPVPSSATTVAAAAAEAGSGGEIFANACSGGEVVADACGSSEVAEAHTFLRGPDGPFSATRGAAAAAHRRASGGTRASRSFARSWKPAGSLGLPAPSPSSKRRLQPGLMLQAAPWRPAWRSAPGGPGAANARAARPM